MFAAWPANAGMPFLSDSSVRPVKEYHIAKNRNTYAKQQREQEKRQRADDKRLKRERKISAPTRPELPGGGPDQPENDAGFTADQSHS